MRAVYVRFAKQPFGDAHAVANRSSPELRGHWVALASLTVLPPTPQDGAVNGSSNVTAKQPTEVTIHVATDADASRIRAVLEAIGFTVVRVLDQGDAPSRLAWAIEGLSTRHNLTERERDVLAGVLEGLDNQALARTLEISRATVKWHLHNVFAKTGTQNREALLRAALQLGGRSE
jgi:DNA-binding CsgD family transcriptional regulator